MQNSETFNRQNEQTARGTQVAKLAMFEKKKSAYLMSYGTNLSLETLLKVKTGKCILIGKDEFKFEVNQKIGAKVTPYMKI